MKYAFLAFIVITLFACKSSNEVKSSEEKVIDVPQNPWEKINFKPEKGMVLPNGYSTYLLNSEIFNTQLKQGTVQIPIEDGSYIDFKVENSGTMSPELQAKFPNLRSYVGNSPENALCQARIDQKDLEFKIVLLCNTGTVYVQELHDLGIYFVYNKKNLPDGVGTVKE